jgi:hypothetical protein
VAGFRAWLKAMRRGKTRTSRIDERRARLLVDPAFLVVFD